MAPQHGQSSTLDYNKRFLIGRPTIRMVQYESFCGAGCVSLYLGGAFLSEQRRWVEGASY